MAASLVNQFKDMTLEYDAPNGATLYVYTDMPGATMALRRTFSIPATTGRQTYVFAFDGPAREVIEGTLIQTKITSGGVCRLFKGGIRHRRIGVYFDGARGEIWQTIELAY